MIVFLGFDFIIFLDYMKPVKVVSYGVGVIGRRLIDHLLSKEGVQIVGAIDINPNIVGKDLGEVMDREKLGVIISNDGDKVLSDTKPDIVCHTLLLISPKDSWMVLKRGLKRGIRIRISIDSCICGNS